jgi:hypothetical protein
MSQTATTYRPSPRRVSIFGFVLCSVLAILFWSVAPHSWNVWIARSISVVCGLIALMLIFYKEITIDSAAGIVTETTLLFGFLRVRRRHRPFAEFKAIRSYISTESDGGVPTWAVALVPRTGYALDLRYFSDAAASRDSAEFANDLERSTGLEVEQKPA